MRKQTAKSFWAKVKKGRGCWEWQGSCNSTGYGSVAWGGKTYTAHRIAAWLVGSVTSPAAPISKRDKTHILHKCDNRKCCRPSHFFLGNYADNQRDAYTKAQRTQPRGEKHTNSKLTNKQAEAIRIRYKRGELQVPLAKEFGVSQRVISLIVRGKTYV
jgi:hypothetical protein